MKKILKVISVILCFVMLAPAVPVFAKEGKFVSYTVQTIDEYGEIDESEEIGYTDNSYLYVPVDFLSYYTLFYYDEATTSFVRKGQPENSKYGRVQIDISNKKVKVFMNPFSSKEYDLHDIYTFGEKRFLPLEQMAAFLKAVIEIDGTAMRISNSGYSLADAEYAYSTIMSNMSLVNFGYSDIVDDIYAGSETAFFASSVINYFGATVFGVRISNLDVFTHLGDKDEYGKFLEKCVTNNDEYINAITDNDDLIERFNNAKGLNKSVNDFSKSMKSITSIVKSVSNPLKDSSMANALLYVDASNWNATFDAASTVTNVADYFLKLGSMCEDNKAMINNFEKTVSLQTHEIPFHLAVQSVDKKFGSDFVTSIFTKALEVAKDNAAEMGKQILVEAGKDAALSTGANIVLKKVIPAIATIKCVATVFKLLGFDLTANSEYCIMIDFNAKSQLFNYFNSQPDKHFKNSNSSEDFRLSAAFFLVSCIQSFKEANNLSKKMDGYDSLYNDEIAILTPILDLFYLAAQSKNFDNFAAIEKIIKDNQTIIKNSGILEASKQISESDALNFGRFSDIELQNNLHNSGTFTYDNNYYYYIDQNVEVSDNYADFNTAIFKADISGSKKEKIYSSAGTIRDLTSYGNYLYFIDSTGFSNIFMRMDKSSMKIEALKSFPLLGSTGDYTICDNMVYVNVENDSGGEILRFDVNKPNERDWQWLFSYGIRYNEGKYPQLKQIASIDSLLVLNNTLYFNIIGTVVGTKNPKFGGVSVELVNDIHSILENKTNIKDAKFYSDNKLGSVFANGAIYSPPKVNGKDGKLELTKFNIVNGEFTTQDISVVSSDGTSFNEIPFSNVNYIVKGSTMYCYTSNKIFKCDLSQNTGKEIVYEDKITPIESSSAALEYTFTPYFCYCKGKILAEIIENDYYGHTLSADHFNSAVDISTWE